MNRVVLIPEEPWNDPDPFLREIWQIGIIKVCHDYCAHEVVFITERNIKRIGFSEFNSLVMSSKIMTGILPDGRCHSWISEGDGSAERFRNVFKDFGQTVQL